MPRHARVLGLVALCSCTRTAPARDPDVPMIQGERTGAVAPPPVLVLSLPLPAIDKRLDAQARMSASIKAVPIACAGPDGVRGGQACLVGHPERVRVQFLERAGGFRKMTAKMARRDHHRCADIDGDLAGAGLVADTDSATSVFPVALTLGVAGDGNRFGLEILRDRGGTPPLAVDLDGDGTDESIQAGVAAGTITVRDGRDHRMVEELSPFRQADHIVVLATADVDGDGQRELILYGPHVGGWGVAVIEYWASSVAYAFHCADQ